ncbi:MAG: hypothetical protein OCC49_13900 [Fibrobacterales bacterium]
MPYKAVLLLFLFCSILKADQTWLQTDWSGGSGQNEWIVINQYLSDDSQLHTDDVGELGITFSVQNGDGSDGNVTISTVNQIVNTYSAISSTNTAAAQKQVVVQDGSLFSVGDEVLLIQMQQYTNDNSSTAGTYEFAHISSISTNTLTFVINLSYAYYSGNFDMAQANAAQVIRVPNYNNLTISTAASITGSPWNGTTGGVVAFRVKENFIASGATVTADTLGFRGGAGGAGNEAKGWEGEGILGKDMAEGDGDGCNPCNSYPTGINNGGSGGFGRSIYGGGGAGGGHAVAGQNGGAKYIDQLARGGIAVGNAAMTTIFMGGGGGGGGDDDNQHNNMVDPSNDRYFYHMYGGRGGGIIMIYAKTMTGGTLTTKGQSRQTPWVSNGAAEGSGGAGGSIRIQAKDISSVTLDVSGGDGENDYEQITAGWGGDGSNGRMLLEYSSKTSIVNQTGINGANQSISEATLGAYESAEVVSSILDMQSLPGTLFGPMSANWTATLNGGVVKVYLRTALTEGAIPGKAWTQIEKNVIVDYSGDIDYNDRYVQYRALLQVGTESPVLNDITITLGDVVTPPTTPDSLFIYGDSLFTPEDEILSSDSIGWNTPTGFPVNALTYEFEIASDASNWVGTSLYSENIGADTQIDLDTMSISFVENSRYFWRVRAVHPDASMSSWTGDLQSFYINNVNSAPHSNTLHEPTGYEILKSTDTITFRALDVDSISNTPDILTYTIDLSLNKSFTLIASSYSTTDTFAVMGSFGVLVNDQLYFMRVRVQDDGGESGPTITLSDSIRYLFEGNTPPPVPSFTGVSEDDMIIETDVIQWSTSIDPDANPVLYTIEGRSDVNAAAVYYSTGISATSATIAQLITADSLGATIATFNDKNLSLRIKATDSYNESSNWSGWMRLHFNAVNDTPSVASITAPTDNQFFRPPQSITWNSSFHGDQREDSYFSLELGNASDFNVIIESDTLAESVHDKQLSTFTKLDQLIANQEYYLRLKSYDASGNSFGYSQVKSFTYLIDSLFAPATLYSSPGISFVSGNEFSAESSVGWSYSGVYSYGFLTYELIIDNDASFGSPEVRDTLTDTTAVFTSLTGNASLVDNQFYYWIVKEIHPDGTSSNYTDPTSSFFYNPINQAPTLPTNISPLPLNNLELYVTSDSLFRFYSTDADSLGNTPDLYSYTIQVSTDSLFAQIISTIPGVLEDSYVIGSVPGLQDSTEYFWRVFTTDSHGASSDTAGTFSFTYLMTNTPPSVVQFITLPDSTIVDSTTLFKWNRSFDPEGSSIRYFVEFTQDTTRFSFNIISEVTDTTYTYSELITFNTIKKVLTTDTLDNDVYIDTTTSLSFDDQTLYLRIYSIDQFNIRSIASSWTTLFIDSENDTPTQIQLKQPLDDSIDLFETQLITYTQSTDPDRFDTLYYEVEISKTVDFSTLMGSATTAKGDTAIGFTEFTLTEQFANGDYYYVRVRGRDNAGNSAGYTNPRPFKYSANNSRPTTPVITTPADTANTFGPTGLITWSTATDPEGDLVTYELVIVPSDSSFPAILENGLSFATSITNTTYTLYKSTHYEHLQSGTLYAAYVRSVDAFNAPSSPSEPRYFWYFSTKPGAVTLHSPVDSTEGDGTLRLTWSRAVDTDAGVNDTIRYDILLSQSPNYSDTALRVSVVGDTSAALQDLPGMNDLVEDRYYYWKVFAVDPHGEVSESSLTKLFFYNLGNQKPNVPDSLRYLKSDSLFLFDELFWWATDPDISDNGKLVYDLQIDDSDVFQSPIQFSNIPQEFVALNYNAETLQLQKNHEYFWKVRARDPAGETSAYTATLMSFVYMGFDSTMFDISTIYTPSRSVFVHTDSLFWKPVTHLNSKYIVRLYDGSTGGLIGVDTIYASELSTYRYNDSSMYIPLLAVLPDSLYTAEKFFNWSVQAASDTHDPTYGTVVSHYFYLGKKEKLQDNNRTSAWILPKDSVILYSADSLLNVSIPQHSFKDTFGVAFDSVGLFLQELLLDTSSQYTTETNYLIGKINRANRHLAADRGIKYVGQKIFEIHAVDLVSQKIIQPDSSINLVLSMQVSEQDTSGGRRLPRDSLFTYSDTLYDVNETSIFLLDEIEDRWVMQESELINNTTLNDSTSILAKRAEVNPQSIIATTTNHFSVYTILAAKVSLEPFSDFLIYPSPIITSDVTEENRNARISFRITQPTDIAIRIFSRTGKLVWKQDLSEVIPEDGTKNEVIWNCTNLDEYLVGNGYYIVKLKATIKATGKKYIEKQIIAVVK